MKKKLLKDAALNVFISFIAIAISLFAAAATAADDKQPQGAKTDLNPQTTDAKAKEKDADKKKEEEKKNEKKEEKKEEKTEAPINLDEEKKKSEVELLKIQVEKAKTDLEKMKMEAAIMKARADLEKARLELEIQKLKLGKEKLDAASLNKRNEKKIFGGDQKQEQQNEDGYHAHDGFYLRMELGGGYGGFKSDGTVDAPYPVNQIKNPRAKGGLIGGAISAGGAVGDNLLFHGDMWFDVNIMREDDNNLKQSFGVGVFGIGMTYYFMPSNIFITGRVGVATAWFSIMNPRDHYDDYDYEHYSRDATGIGMQLSVGKEWWVSDNWALGLALQTGYAYADSDAITFNHGCAKLVFTTTFN